LGRRTGAYEVTLERDRDVYVHRNYRMNYYERLFVRLSVCLSVCRMTITVYVTTSVINCFAVDAMFT